MRERVARPRSVLRSRRCRGHALASSNVSSGMCRRGTGTQRVVDVLARDRLWGGGEALSVTPLPRPPSTPSPPSSSYRSPRTHRSLGAPHSRGWVSSLLPLGGFSARARRRGVLGGIAGRAAAAELVRSGTAAVCVCARSRRRRKKFTLWPPRSADRRRPGGRGWLDLGFGI